jgi:hypothetical protein
VHEPFGYDPVTFAVATYSPDPVTETHAFGLFPVQPDESAAAGVDGTTRPSTTNPPIAAARRTDLRHPNDFLRSPACIGMVASLPMIVAAPSTSDEWHMQPVRPDQAANR